jgi:hypothetical protein
MPPTILLSAHFIFSKQASNEVVANGNKQLRPLSAVTAAFSAADQQHLSSAQQDR